MRRVRGLSLLEVMISVSLMGLLFALLFVVYRTGAGAWLRGDANAELLGRIQTLSSRIGRAAEGSTSSSLSVAVSDIDPNIKGCGFLSAVDLQGHFQYDPGTSSPKWAFGDVFYFNSSSGQVFVVKHALLGATPVEIAKDYGRRFIKEAPPSTRNPLPDRFTGGQPIAHDIKDISFRAADRIIVNTGHSSAATTEKTGQLEISITVEKKAYGSETPQKISSRSYYFFRN